MMIVEFCGNPACGKSTMSDALYNGLRGFGYRVANLHTDNRSDMSLLTRLFRKMKSCWYRFYPQNKRLKEAMKILQAYENKRSLIDWYDKMLETFYKYKHAERKKNQIGIFDEGCLQLITSVFHDRQIDPVAPEVKEFIEVLTQELYQDRTVVVDCHVDMEENYKRLITRNRRYDKARYLIYSVSSNMPLLEIKRRNLTEVVNMAEDITIIHINLTDIKEDAGKLLNQIQDLYQNLISGK